MARLCASDVEERPGLRLVLRPPDVSSHSPHEPIHTMSAHSDYRTRTRTRTQTHTLTITITHTITVTDSFTDASTDASTNTSIDISVGEASSQPSGGYRVPQTPRVSIDQEQAPVPGGYTPSVQVNDDNGNDKAGEGKVGEDEGDNGDGDNGDDGGKQDGLE